MSDLVSMKGVVRRYVRGKQRVEVLHALDLNIAAGEFLALMGPSGSGKTTLLNLIGGIDRADEGEIRVAGECISALPATALARWRSRNVGFVFQFYNLMPLLSAAQNVELPLLLTGGLSDTIGFRMGFVKALIPDACCRYGGYGSDYSREIYSLDLKLSGFLPRIGVGPGLGRFLLVSLTYGSKGYRYSPPESRQRNIGIDLGLNLPEILRAVGVKAAPR